MLTDEQIWHAWTNGKLSDVSFLAKLCRIAVNDPALEPTADERRELVRDTADYFGRTFGGAVHILSSAAKQGNRRNDEEWQRIQDATEGNWDQ